MITCASAAPLGLPPLQIPPNNPQTPEKVLLGKRLFSDPRFSSTGEVACKTCHLEGIAFQDGRPVPRGVHMEKGTRNAPTVINTAFMPRLFWDGRADSLESQAVMPLFNPVEHGLKDKSQVLAVIQKDESYRSLFEEAFKVPGDSIDIQHFAAAIAAYERTLVAGNSPFDRWFYGKDENAIGEAAKRGYATFIGPGQCAACHTIGAHYALFTDNQFHNANVGFSRLGKAPEALADTYLQMNANNLDQIVLGQKQLSELGRFTVTKQRQDIGAFKTPSLRNIARTPPYLHDGSLNTLEKVVAYFNNGGSHSSVNSAPNPFQSPLIRPLHLSQQQQADLVAFLKTLTSPEYSYGW